MKKISEDEILKPLFDKIGMKEAPGDLTLKVMEQIMVNPEIESVPKFYSYWLWSGIGLLSLLSMYYTGAFTLLSEILTPYFIEIYNLLAVFWIGLAEILPSNIIVLPSSYVLPVLLPGIMFMLLIDMLFGRNIRGIQGW